MRVCIIVLPTNEVSIITQVISVLLSFISSPLLPPSSPLAGQHVYLSAQVDGKLCVRPYTPTTLDDCQGYFDLVVKVYFKNEHPKFPDGGKMSQHLDGMGIGDTIDVRGPSGQLIYEGMGKFRVLGKKSKAMPHPPSTPINAKHVGMIAGGTGITPMYQLMRAVLRNSEDTTRLSLIFANQSEEDILLRDDLTAMASEFGDRVHIWYTLDRPPTDWAYSTGFVSADMIAAHLPPPSDDTLIVLCGPPPMINMACVPALDKLAYGVDNRFAY